MRKVGKNKAKNPKASKKEYWVWLAAIVIIFLVAVAFEYRKAKFEESYNYTQVDDDYNAKLKDIPLDDPKFAQCLGRPRPAKYLCAAVLSRNFSYCEAIAQEHRRIHCIAYIKKKPGMCLNLTYGKEWCLSDIGSNLRDEKLCNLIENESKRLSCLSIAAKDVELCLSLEGDAEENCAIQLAEILHDKSICDKIEYSAGCYDKLRWMR